jgi:hypothetical protein
MLVAAMPPEEWELLPTSARMYFVRRVRCSRSRTNTAAPRASRAGWALGHPAEGAGHDLSAEEQERDEENAPEQLF